MTTGLLQDSPAMPSSVGPRPSRARFLTTTLNPAIDVAYETPRLRFGERLFVADAVRTAGGKGLNCARVLQGLDVPVLALATAGGSTGERLRDLVRDEGLAAELIPVRGETRSNITVTDARGTVLKMDQRGHAPGPEELQRIETVLTRQLRGACWLVLAGSLAPGTPSDIYARLAVTAHDADVRVLVDTSGPPLEHALASQPDILKPNRSEAEALLGRRIRTPSDAAKAAVAIRNRGAQLVVVTLGEDGAVAAGEDGVLYASANPTASGCPVGAGDALGAALVWALQRGESLARALQWAVAAGTATAALPGLQAASREEIASLRPRVQMIVP